MLLATSNSPPTKKRPPDPNLPSEVGVLKVFRGWFEGGDGKLGSGGTIIRVLRVTARAVLKPGRRTRHGENLSGDTCGNASSSV